MKEGQAYIAKQGGWFIPGSWCELVTDCGEQGIFLGFRRSESDYESEPPGTIYLDEEYCPYEEFEHNKGVGSITKKLKKIIKQPEHIDPYWSTNPSSRDIDLIKVLHLLEELNK